MSTGVGIPQTSSNPNTNAQLQKAAAWAFAIDQGRQARSKEDALLLARMYEAAAAVHATELTYDALQRVIDEEKQRRAAGVVLIAQSNPFRDVPNIAEAHRGAYNQAKPEEKSQVRNRLTPEKQEALTELEDETENDDENSAPVDEVPAAKPIPAPFPGASPQESEADEDGQAAEGPDAAEQAQSEEPETDLPGIDAPFPGGFFAAGGGGDSPAEKKPGGPQMWFDKIGANVAHNIKGQKVMLYGQRAEALGRAGRIASRAMRKRGGPAQFGNAKKLENLARSTQKVGKALQKGGKYLAAAQAVKEFASGDLKKSVATAVRTGGSILITQLAFWVSGLFGLTIKGLVVTAVVWNIILIASKLFKLSIPSWMKWSIIAFDIALPMLLVLIVIALFVVSCYISHGNFITDLLSGFVGLFSSVVGGFNQFCTGLGI